MCDKSQEVLLAEYDNIRKEILQLNGQAFSTFAASLTLYAAILGIAFTKLNDTDPNVFYYILSVGNFLLTAAVILMVNRDRVSHRLSLFQEYYIEKRLCELRWAKTYYTYVEISSKRFLSRWSERLVGASVNLIVGISILNLFLLIGIRGQKSLYESIQHKTDHTMAIIILVNVVLILCEVTFDCLFGTVLGKKGIKLDVIRAIRKVKKSDSRHK